MSNYFLVYFPPLYWSDLRSDLAVFDLRLPVPIVATPRAPKAVFPPHNHPPTTPPLSLPHPFPSLSHNAPGPKLKTQHANPACPNRLGVWYSNNHSGFCPVRFPPYATHDRHIVQFRWRWLSFRERRWVTPSLPLPTLYLPRCLSLPWLFPLITEGCWNITGCVPGTHPKTHSTHGYPLSSSHNLSYYIMLALESGLSLVFAYQKNTSRSFCLLWTRVKEEPACCTSQEQAVLLN